LWCPGRDPSGWWLALDASPFAFGPNAMQNALTIEALTKTHPERVAYNKEGFLLLKPVYLGRAFVLLK
jgi:hypothetical protein